MTAFSTRHAGIRVHERLGWRVAPSALHMARALATGEEYFAKAAKRCLVRKSS